MRYSITCDAQLYRVVDQYSDVKTGVMGAIIHIAKGSTCIVERTRVKDDGAGDHVIIGYWHVFANDGYHLIDVVRLL